MKRKSWYGFSMRLGVQIVGVSLLLACVFQADVRAQETAAKGFVSNPFDWPDYGGTPDIKVAQGVGLQKAELDSILARLSSPSQSDRTEAINELMRNAPGSQEVLRAALWGRHGVKNSAMKAAIRAARKRVNGSGKLIDQLAAIDPSNPELGEGASGSLRILNMLCALDSLNTLATYKILIEFSPRHAGVFRHEIGKKLVAHGYDVLPALIYSRGSDNQEIHMFCVKWIRDMGNPLLGEQLKIKNPRRLAQLLEAYASVNDLDAIDVTLSLTNHDSVIVRQAARRCIDKYGKNAKWPVRRFYENTFAREPSADQGVTFWAKELYAHFDTQRMKPMTDLFEKGLAAHESGAYKEMDAAFRAVLRNEPMFPRRHEMATCYHDLATNLFEEDLLAEAKATFTLAQRLVIPGSDIAKSIKASLTWIRAEELREAGTVDPELYKIVLENDPDHPHAQSRYDTLTGQAAPLGSLLTKALIVSFFVFLAALLVMKRMKP